LTALLIVGCVAETTLAAWENPPVGASPKSHASMLACSALAPRADVEHFRGHRPMSSQDDFALKISALARLSPREREVLTFVDEGKTRTDIAARLHLSPKTVDTYRSRILAKLEKTFRAFSNLPSAPS
jgi:DNA-binding NarL/FixJ family response regulator